MAAAWELLDSATAKRKQLLQAGYLPLPAVGKAIAIPGWTDVAATEKIVDDWGSRYPAALNTGVLTKRVPVIDIDITDEVAAAYIEDLAREAFEERGDILVRFGAFPKRAIPLRTSQPFKKIKLALTAPNGNKAEIEILGDGQQFIVDGIHPDTQVPYRWHGGEPWTTPAEELPYVSEEQARQFLRDAERLLVEQLGYTPVAAAAANGETSAPEALFNQVYPAGTDWPAALARIRAGVELHDTLCSLSMSAIASGMNGGAAIRILEALMEESAAPRDERWQARRDEIPRLVRSAIEKRGRAAGASVASVDAWPDPKPIVEALLPVAAFKGDFVPASLAPWIEDISDRLQCPGDFVAVAAITALGAVIGRRVGMKPQLKTDWIEFPNVWGAFIGRPGALKSPAMGEALKPIHRLEAEAAKDNQVAQEAYAAGLDAFKLKKQVFASLAKEEMKSQKKTNIKVEFDLGEEPKAPTPIRFRTNDSSYESLGELLIGNPTGVLVERDELISLLQHLDRDEQCVAKGFYLSGWGGSQPYTFDRIGRGHRHVDAVCLSVLGNTQPARIAEYVRQSNKGGAGGDGLLQRFSLLVWPDAPATWRDVDQYPVGPARERAWEVFMRLSKLEHSSVLSAGAELGAFDKTPAFRFTDDAHATFLAWRGDLEAKLRRGELSASLEGHLAKYRKLVPSLALINHLADGGTGFVAPSSLKRAIGFAEYLETHARRLYGSGSEIETAAAKAILRHIRKGDLSDGFTARDVHRPKWTGLTDIAHVELGLTLLVDLDYLAASSGLPGDRGGRPTTTYRINPKGQ
jgi:putative DNA primase/helicase